MVLIATIALITTNNFSKEAYAQEAQSGLKFVGAGLASG